MKIILGAADNQTRGSWVRSADAISKEANLNSVVLDGNSKRRIMQVNPRLGGGGGGGYKISQSHQKKICPIGILSFRLILIELNLNSL